MVGKASSRLSVDQYFACGSNVPDNSIVKISVSKPQMTELIADHIVNELSMYGNVFN